MFDSVEDSSEKGPSSRVSECLERMLRPTLFRIARRLPKRRDDARLVKPDRRRPLVRALAKLSTQSA